MNPLPIHVHRFQSGNIEIHVPATQEQAFKELIQRATNLWPDAPPAVKAFADLITNDGKLMQDYSKATVTNQDWICLRCGSRTKGIHNLVNDNQCPGANNT